MTRRTGVSIAGVVGSVLALVLAFVTQQVANLGGVQCQVYCGPGPRGLPFGWMVATAVVWLAALLLSVTGLVMSRARSEAGWAGIALSAVLPLVVAVLVTHPVAGS
jgi:hypothetical protein